MRIRNVARFLRPRYLLPGSTLNMKTKIISFIVLAMYGFVAAETAVAEAPKTQPAQEALNGVQPFIGSWTAESDAYEGFEGNEEGGKIDVVLRFRWLQEKAAVEFSSRIVHIKTGESFNSGSKIMSLNAGTDQLQVFGYGYDGDVYFSNTGSMDLKDKKITWKMNEITINKTKSEYTVMFSLENPNLLSVQLTDRVVDGKKQEDWSTKLHRITKAASK